ncbi:MAG: hypothetical protein SF052_12690 [Bacteroidia bacterium]|nr:hypothetical protein [Bacteroidia bacterium]
MNLRIVALFLLLIAEGVSIGLSQNLREGWICNLSGNDSTLIVELQISDPVIRDQIVLTGLTLWILPDKKKKSRKGIRFPLGLPEENRTHDPGILQDQRAELPITLPGMIAAMNSLELINFYGEGEITWGSNQNPGGINTRLQYGLGSQLLYRAILPLSVIMGKDADLFREGGEKYFGILFETGRLSRPLIRGDMGVGVSGYPGSPSSVTGSYDRAMQNILEEYRLFTVPAELYLKKQQIPRRK